MIRAYFNERADIWDETIAEKDAAKLDRMVQRLNVKPGSTVLDVGTGTGVFVPFLLNRIGGRGQLVAIDIAEEMLKRSMAKSFGGNIKYIHADITSIPFIEGTFNAIVCYSSFPHFQNKPRALVEITRVLKSDGGLFICHTESRSVINSIHREIPAVKNDIIPDMADMLTMLSEAGFTDVEIDDGCDSYLISAMKP